MKKNKTLCVFCGNKEATTKDHIPPKAIFPTPRPHNLVTVPACKECNNSCSSIEEEFASRLSLLVGIEEKITIALHERNKRILLHNKKLRRQIFNSIEKVYIKENGIIVGKEFKIPWKAESHDKLIEKMIRGLYFYHYGQIIDDKIGIKVQWLNKLPKDFLNLIAFTPIVYIGNKNQFIYRYANAIESPTESIWLFLFFNKHLASGYTYIR